MAMEHPVVGPPAHFSPTRTQSGMWYAYHFYTTSDCFGWQFWLRSKEHTGKTRTLGGRDVGREGNVGRET